MKKLFFILFIISLIFASCYLTPETEKTDGDISVSIPRSSLPQREYPYGTAGFQIFIFGTTIEDPENMNPDDEIIFYQKEILLSGDVFTENPNFPEPYSFTLNNVPEGDNLYMVIIYLGENIYYDEFYDDLYGLQGYFISPEPFSVKSGQTTKVTLVSHVYDYQV
ncbi:MAG: hypothetical protein RBT69_10375 [Spirochaetia bacterium]|jgi:hypothetical protein|nr:hypothetical protein [Spirochaetia bacterium]